jgi:hypothetical protein
MGTPSFLRELFPLPRDLLLLFKELKESDLSLLGSGFVLNDEVEYDGEGEEEGFKKK